MKKSLKLLAVAMLLGGGLVSCGDDPVKDPNTDEPSVPETAVVPEVNPYQVNISDLTAGDITEDVKLGAFTFVKNGDNTESSVKKPMKVEELDTPLEFSPELTFNKVLKTQSASQTDAAKLGRVISFEVTGKGTVTLYGKSGSSTDLTRSVSVYHVGNAVVHDKVTLGADVEAHTLTFHYSGTHYLTSSANVSIYYIAVNFEDGVNEEWEPAIELKDANQLNVSELPAKTYTKDIEVGNFVIHATSEASQSVEVDGNSSKTYDGVKYTNRLKLGGKGTSTYRSVDIKVTAAARITVVAISSNGSADRLLALFNGETQVGESATVKGTGVDGFIWNVTDAGTYNLRSLDGGINIYNIIIEYAA